MLRDRIDVQSGLGRRLGACGGRVGLPSHVVLCVVDNRDSAEWRAVRTARQSEVGVWGFFLRARYQLGMIVLDAFFLVPCPGRDVDIHTHCSLLKVKRNHMGLFNV